MKYLTLIILLLSSVRFAHGTYYGSKKALPNGTIRILVPHVEEVSNGVYDYAGGSTLSQTFHGVNTYIYLRNPQLNNTFNFDPSQVSQYSDLNNLDMSKLSFEITSGVNTGEQFCENKIERLGNLNGNTYSSNLLLDDLHSNGSIDHTGYELSGCEAKNSDIEEDHTIMHIEARYPYSMNSLTGKVTIFEIFIQVDQTTNQAAAENLAREVKQCLLAFKYGLVFQVMIKPARDGSVNHFIKCNYGPFYNN